MVKIRQGMMKDCKDLLEVYMGTRWSEGFTTVEQIKAEHRGVCFKKWGWLVAEQRGKVVGEILFRLEKNPIAGRIGIIRSLGVDVRHQKKGYGTKLTRAAEEVLRGRRVGRIVATTPPEAYNYWMKIDYHKRYWVMRIQNKPSKIPPHGTKKIITSVVRGAKTLPKTLRFSNFAYPGLLAEIVREIVTIGKPGTIMEYLQDETLVGVGAVVLENDRTARFAADVTKSGEAYSDLVVARTSRAAAKINADSVYSLVPQDRLPWYMKICNWTTEMDRNFPVTRLA
ncbi:MAG: GNAT family N-acetyltransferase [Promethearchaeota archaeon]